MKSHGRPHKQTITCEDALDIWRLLGCQPRGHEIVAKESFSEKEFLSVTNSIVERAQRKDGDFYERIFRMIDFHGRKQVDLDDLKTFCRACGEDVSEEVLKSLIHTIDSSGDDEFITKEDYIDWFEGHLIREANPGETSK